MKNSIFCKYPYVYAYITICYYHVNVHDFEVINLNNFYGGNWAF